MIKLMHSDLMWMKNGVSLKMKGVIYNNYIYKMLEEIPKNINLNIEIKAKSISTEKWVEELNKLRVSRQDMNKLVLNYLIIEGYKDASEKFIKETGIKGHLLNIIIAEYDSDLLEKRMKIRTLIMSGKIDEAVNDINDINSEVTI